MIESDITGLEALRRPAPGMVLPQVLVRTGLADRFVTRPTAIGPVFVVVGPRGVAAVEMANDPGAFAAGYQQRFGRPAFPASDLPAALIARVDRALREGRPGSLPIDLTRLTPFHASVLRKAAEIPRGEVRPYRWVAAEIGNRGAGRAVGTALATNPIPLIVPCHRVVRADGRLGRYSLGADANKRRLLEAEGVDPAGLEALAGRGIRFLGSTTTGVYCLPTCRQARRITARYRREFHAAAEAAGAGFRPCRLCRPAA